MVNIYYFPPQNQKEHTSHVLILII